MSVRSSTEIVTVVAAQPNAQFAHRVDGALLHVMQWACGCSATNGGGLCRLDGWEWAPCAAHQPLGSSTVPTLRADLGASAQAASL